MPSNATESTAAMGIVIIANWLLSHLVMSWAMPPEVQSAVQALIVITLGSWFKARWMAGQVNGTGQVTTSTVAPDAASQVQPIGKIP